MELLIRATDKAEAENASKRGDVIAACPDGWEWSAAERGNPDWIIIQANITQIEADALLEGFRPGEPQYRRRLGVNPNGLKSGDGLSRTDLTARIF